MLRTKHEVVMSLITFQVCNHKVQNFPYKNITRSYYCQTLKHNNNKITIESKNTHNLFMCLKLCIFGEYIGIYFDYFGNNRFGLFSVIFFGNWSVNRSFRFFRFRQHLFSVFISFDFFYFWLVKIRLPNQKTLVGNRSVRKVR